MSYCHRAIGTGGNGERTSKAKLESASASVTVHRVLQRRIPLQLAPSNSRPGRTVAGVAVAPLHRARLFGQLGEHAQVGDEGVDGGRFGGDLDAAADGRWRHGCTVSSARAATHRDRRGAQAEGVFLAPK